MKTGAQKSRNIVYDFFNNFWKFFTNLYQLIKHQSYYHIETSQLICRANQLTGFHMMAALASNDFKTNRNKIFKVYYWNILVWYALSSFKKHSSRDVLLSQCFFKNVPKCKMKVLNFTFFDIISTILLFTGQNFSIWCIFMSKIC